MKHANYNKLTGNEHCEKLKQLEDVLTAQLRFFTRARESNENATKASYEVATLIAKHCKPFTEDDVKLPWNKVTGIITDGAPAMAGEQSGISTLVCNKVSEEGGKAIKLHCIIHQQVLCAKHLKYDHAMKPVIKAINYIRSKALCHRQFQQFLLDIQAEYGDVVYHNDVRWLSRGSALQRFYSLREEIGQFLAKKGQLMLELSDPIWLADFGFLVDITRHLNALNTSLQGQNGVNNISAQMRRYAADISSLDEEFQWRFRDFAAIEKDIRLFSSPFSVDPDDAPDHLQLELTELQCDAECHSRHQQLPLVNFYRQLDKGRFQEIRTFAKKMLSLFGSTYLCEKTFLVMNINKNCMRMRLSDSHLRDILRIKTTVFEPDLAYLLQSRSQYHPSH
ncbi:general transcription factor II-I repeat domain-containing protein 2A isoform X1 [Ictalurus furcatus]|uniref:general transcription factor II-I repeat domain-containing protein 2A isoform X1 n=1 Tax=Ictalurus furcatus TaxID=66913 RepID=UPI00235007AE|nr:general transcription factor II-I repeat domain-containing protein 2A isoform X1 [Ictalurus furcatus]